MVCKPSTGWSQWGTMPVSWFNFLQFPEFQSQLYPQTVDLLKKTLNFKGWSTNSGFGFHPCFGCSNLSMQCTCLEGLLVGRQKSIRELCFQCLAMLHRSRYSFSQHKISIRAMLLVQSDLWRFQYLQAVLKKHHCYCRVLENITAV